MNTTISLHPHEARTLSDNRLGVLVRPVEPQPPERHNVLLAMHSNPSAFRWGISDFPKGEGPSWELWPDGPLKSPFGAPGTTLECREPLVRTDTWRYAADNGAINSSNAGAIIAWVMNHHQKSWPASRMPSFLVRHRRPVESVTCKRVGDLTEEEAKAWGCEGVFKHDDPSYPNDGAFYHIDSAKNLFTSLYGPGVWEANTWVWVAVIGNQ